MKIWFTVCGLRRLQYDGAAVVAALEHRAGNNAQARTVELNIVDFRLRENLISRDNLRMGWVGCVDGYYAIAVGQPDNGAVDKRIAQRDRGRLFAGIRNGQRTIGRQTGCCDVENAQHALVRRIIVHRHIQPATAFGHAQYFLIAQRQLIAEYVPLCAS